jgi:hypothetical protein
LGGRVTILGAVDVIFWRGGGLNAGGIATERAD